MSDELDVDYIRSHPQNLDRLVEHQRIRRTPMPGGDICRAERLTLDDGTSLFAKSLDDAPPGFFATEASGLQWLGEAGAVAVPDVIAYTDTMLVLTWVEPGRPTADASTLLGAELARLHLAGADAFGAPWGGFSGSLQFDNSPAADWVELYGQRRVLPALRRAREAGAITPADAAAVEHVVDSLPSLGGPPEPPARVHGDLWSGNLLASAEGPIYLVDPAAYGGHRESDLAMLALFGAPYLGQTLSAYERAAADLGSPLADGWRDRVGLHQLAPLLVHAALFGGGYGARAGQVARHYT